MHKVRGLLCFSFSQLFVIIMLTLVYVVSVLCVLQLLLIEFLSQHRRTHTHTHTHTPSVTHYVRCLYIQYYPISSDVLDECRSKYSVTFMPGRK